MNERPSQPAPTAGERLAAEVAADRQALDPAQKSLAEALRITYRIVQLVVVLLFALFVLSGFETVGEGERGVSLTFGAINQSDLPPGQQFHLPYPVGELLTVHTGSNEITIDRDFYPGRTTAGRPTIRSVRSLKPGRDGSLLTGDGAVVHAQWSVVYRIDEAGVGDYVRRIHPEETRDLVRSAVKRGAVRVLASLTVDDFLKQSTIDLATVGEATIETRVREVAQRTLDDIGSGIVIDRVTLSDRSPPGFVKEVFDEVSRQTSEASQAREEAERYAREQLSAVAGGAAETLIELIDRFEEFTDLGNTEAAEAVLATIDGILSGDPIETAQGSRVVSGAVTRIVSEAQQYRTDVVTRAQAAADRFVAKLQLYRDNPAVFVSSEWSQAYQRFIQSAGPEVFAMPGGADLEILLSRDPDIARNAEAERNAAQATDTLERRREEILGGAARQRENNN